MEATLQVKGMSCGHCEKSVKSALDSLKGVSAVEVHLDEGTVDVIYDDNEVSLKKISEAVEDQGYDVVN